MILAGMLSRAILKDTTQIIPKNKTTTYIHYIVHHLPVSDKILKKIRHETSLDPIMQAISKYLSLSWQGHIQRLFGHSGFYWQSDKM